MQAKKVDILCLSNCERQWAQADGHSDVCSDVPCYRDAAVFIQIAGHSYGGLTILIVISVF